MERYKSIERSIITTYRKCIWRKFIKGINAYKMINEGDKIAVCVSGGVSSMLLAKCMQEIHSHGVVRFDLEFITIAPDDLNERQKILDNAKTLRIPVRVFDTDENVTDRLYAEAEKLGCNKIALGHHFDDVIEAILEGMLYNGRIQTIMPKLHSESHTGMELVRPLYMVKEKDITAWARHCELEFTRQSAQASEIKELVRKFRRTSPYIDMNIFNSVQNVNLTTVIGYRGKGREYNFLDDYDERGN